MAKRKRPPAPSTPDGLPVVPHWVWQADEYPSDHNFHYGPAHWAEIERAKKWLTDRDIGSPNQRGETPETFPLERDEHYLIEMAKRRYEQETGEFACGVRCDCKRCGPDPRDQYGAAS